MKIKKFKEITRYTAFENIGVLVLATQIKDFGVIAGYTTQRPYSIGKLIEVTFSPQHEHTLYGSLQTVPARIWIRGEDRNKIYSDFIPYLPNKKLEDQVLPLVFSMMKILDINILG